MAKFFRSVAGAICGHMDIGLMHKVGDVEALSQHITMLYEDRALLERLRAASLKVAPEITWTAAGRILLQAYRETIAAHRAGGLGFMANGKLKTEIPDNHDHMDRVRAIGRYIASRTGLYGPARVLYRSLFDAPGRKRRDSIRRFYRQIVKSADLVFDIGANIGSYSEIFASLGAHVVAVEPLPENMLVLQNCAYKKRVRVVQAAAGSQIGTGNIRRSTEHTMASMSREWIDACEASPRIKAFHNTWLDEIEVPTTTLDSLSQAYGVPDFIKIDVEGYEESVLDGLSLQPPCISFEFNPETLQVAQRCLEKPIFSPASECNFIVGEPERFVLDAWTNIGSVLSHIIASRPDTFGDIFIRRPSG